MCPNRRWRAEASVMQHRWPEQSVEVDDVLANEVIDLGRGIHLPEVLEIHIFSITEVFEAGEIANRCIQPNIEKLTGSIRDFKTKIGCITAYIPLLQTCIQPLSKLIGHLWLQGATAGPLGQEVGKLRQLEEIVLRLLLDGGGAGYRRAWINQLSRRVGCTAGLTVVTILVIRLALRAGAFDKPVCEKHVLLGIERLGNLTRRNVAVLLQLTIDVFRKVAILFRMGGVIVVKADMKPAEILLVLLTDAVDQPLGRNTLALGTEHNGCAVGIIRANVVASVASHILIAHPDVRLNVFQQMA